MHCCRLYPSLLAVAVLLSCGTAQADENLFGYTYGAETLPKGKSEFYTWQTFRIGKESGHYLGWDQKYEYEWGITDRLQASVYLNFNAVDIDDVPGFTDRSDFGFMGTQVAFKYNVLSPFKDPIGLSFYIEPGYIARDRGTGEAMDAFELETMIILQKNFFDDTLMWYTNIFGEFAWEKIDGEFGHGWGPTVFSGLTYRVAPKWFVGVEGHWDGDFDGFQSSHFQHWDVFLGPVVHYGSKDWWATLSVQMNVASGPNTPGSHLNLDDHEQLEVRLKVGFNF
jgi:hypothetical protein